MALTTIAIDTITRDEFKELGMKGETWDQLVKRVISIVKSNTVK